VLATVTSDDRGYFCFDNLPFGTYTVQEVPQNGYMPGNPASGSFIDTIDLHLALLDEQANPVVTRTVQASTDITSVPDTGVLTRFSDGPRLLGTIPSPIATQAVIRFWSPSTQSIRLELFDIIGDRVATIADGPANEGVNTVRMDASSLLPGTYLVRLTAGSSISTTTVVIVR
jgi:hypothetical protein